MVADRQLSSGLFLGLGFGLRFGFGFGLDLSLGFGLDFRLGFGGRGLLFFLLAADGAGAQRTNQAERANDCEQFLHRDPTFRER